MTTFVLTKYSQIETTDTPDTAEQTQVDKKEVEIEITGSISEVIAKALYSYFEKKEDVKIEESEDRDSDIKVVGTESINADPISTFKKIHNNDSVLILSKGFTTAKEEWFLLNIENKTKNVFYTIESFLSFIDNKLNQP